MSSEHSKYRHYLERLSGLEELVLLSQNNVRRSLPNGGAHTSVLSTGPEFPFPYDRRSCYPARTS